MLAYAALWHRRYTLQVSHVLGTLNITSLWKEQSVDLLWFSPHASCCLLLDLVCVRWWCLKIISQDSMSSGFWVHLTSGGDSGKLEEGRSPSAYSYLYFLLWMLFLVMVLFSLWFQIPPGRLYPWVQLCIRIGSARVCGSAFRFLVSLPWPWLLDVAPPILRILAVSHSY